MQPPLPASRASLVDELIARHRDEPGALMPLLHAIQEALGYVPSDAVPALATALNLSRAEVHGVITYYHFFRDEPPGRHVVEVCRAESCKATGADALMAHAEATLGCASHHTRDDGVVTLLPAFCLGLCAQSPAIVIDDRVHARMSLARFDRLIAAIGEAA